MAKDKFIEAARNGQVLIQRCLKCKMDLPSTARFCARCGSAEMSGRVVPGRGHIATYTIITVPPAEFESYTPYAFVVMTLESTTLRISGFMGGIASPADLPVGAEACVTGYDERGLLIEKA